MKSSSPVPELSFLPAPYRDWTRACERRVQAPVVRKPINANPRLNRQNPRRIFTNRRIIGWKRSQTNQNGGLTLCWICFNPEPREERKAIQATWRLFRIWFYCSLTDEPFRVRFSRAFSSFHTKDRSLFGDPQNGFTRERSKKFQHFRSQR